MKTFTKILTAFLTTALLAAGCVNEDPAYRNQPGTTPVDPDAKGYLALGDMTMRVVTDTDTETKPDDTGDETTKPASRAAAAEPDVDAFIVTILDASGVQQLRQTYGELKAAIDTDGHIELPVGSYTIEVRSEETTPDAEWEHPVYFGSQDFVIEKNKTATVDEVVCTLSNIKVTVLCSKDLADQLTDATQSTVSLGEVSMPFSKSETRAAYFRPQGETNTLTFHVEGAFVESPDSPVRVTKTITNVKAGQWRKIALVITYSDKGDINLDIEVDGFIEDDEIEVGDNTQEPPFPVAPALECPGLDFSAPFQIKASMFDAGLNFTGPSAFNLTAVNGIERFVLNISSDNTALTGMVAGIGGPEFDLCTLTDPTSPAYTTLSELGFPLGDAVKGSTAKSFDLAAAMKTLYENYDGTHTFSFTLTDAKELSTPVTLTLVVDKQNETTTPTIVMAGHDIATPYVLDNADLIHVDIATPGSTIRSIRVKIESATLEEILAEMPRLVDWFDLCEIQPTDPEAEILKGIVGFPLGDEVLGQSEVYFEIISDIVGLLQSMEPEVAGQPNTYKFLLEVTDEAGNKTSATLELVQPTTK